MSIVVRLENIFLYFDNNLSHFKVKNFHSICLAKSIRHNYSLIKGHSKSYKCCCFECIVYQMLVGELFFRGHKKLVTTVTNSNYMSITNKNIYDCIKK